MSLQTFSITEPTRSTMFLNDLTVVDHAYIDDEGRIVGGSFHPCFEVSGTPDPVEKVVVDFSAIKHDIKELIDQHLFNMHDNGFDHKVWIIDGFSKVNNIARPVSGSVQTTITTPVLSLSLPLDAVKFVDKIEGLTPRYTDDYIGAAFAALIQPRLREQYPTVDITVKCINTQHTHIADSEVARHQKKFRYVHGLKDSTSYGCNNIAHGHGSFIATTLQAPRFIYQDTNQAAESLLTLIASELDDTVFVRQENIVGQDHTLLTIEYTTPRGRFEMVIDHTVHKVVVLNTETTVEFLAQYVNARFGSLMREAGMSDFYISEGLSKGAVVLL